MSVTPKDLVKNDFWRKKMLAIFRVRDVNKDGFLSRADFKITIQCYKDLGSSEEHLKKLDTQFDMICMNLGLKDDSVRLTFEEIMANFEKSDSKDENVDNTFKLAFEMINSSGNGVISFKEWVDYYRVFGIDTAYARASFDAMDTNSDGIVSKEEFFTYNIEYYKSVEDKLHSSIMYGLLDKLTD